MSAQHAIDFLRARGWAADHACGIAANLQAESDFRIDAVGDGGLAYGIAQWHPPRQADFARVFGKPIQGSTLDEQLAFVDWELRNTERHAGTALRATLTANEAAAVVSRLYERPADADGEAKRRAAIAAKLAAEYAPQPAPEVLVEGPKATNTAPTPQPAPQPEKKGGFMAPLLAVLAAAVPEIAKLFAGDKSKSEVAQRNTALAPIIADVAIKAADAVGLGDAVEKATSDPQVAAKIGQAIRDDPALAVMLVEAGGGGIGGARAFVAQAAGGPQGAAMTNTLRWVTFWVLGFLTFANLAGFAMAGILAWNGKTAEWQQIVSTLIQADINAAFAAIGFWLGSSLAKGGTPSINVRSDAQ